MLFATTKMSYYRNQESTFNYLDEKWGSDTAKNVSSTQDSLKSHIETQKTSTKNIEDRYYGEKDSTYSDDKKFYNNKTSDNNNLLLYIIGGLGLAYFIFSKS